jgi:hypothetical protein
MRNKSLLYQLALGLLAGILIMPPPIAYAQWTVFDPSQYVLQVSKKVEEANRWLQHYTNLVQQLTTLSGVLISVGSSDYERDHDLRRGAVLHGHPRHSDNDHRRAVAMDVSGDRLQSRDGAGLRIGVFYRFELGRRSGRSGDRVLQLRVSGFHYSSTDKPRAAAWAIMA